MTTIYIIRHAEAEGNLYRRIHGWYNSLITENGYRQIAALAARFRDVAHRRGLLQRPFPHYDHRPGGL